MTIISEAIFFFNTFYATLLQCFRYILQNPVKAGICQYAFQYSWNSYSYYYNTTDTFIYQKFLSDFFESKKDMDEFLAIENAAQFIDIPQNTKSSDEEIKELLKLELKGKTLAELEKKLQKEVLKKIIGITDAGVEQLSKITGIGPGIIRRIKY